jgi:hypothetical protein
MFRGGVKSTGYSLHSPVSPSLPLPCVTVCRHISTGLYSMETFKKRFPFINREWAGRKLLPLLWRQSQYTNCSTSLLFIPKAAHLPSLHPLHFPTLYPMSKLHLPEGLARTVCEQHRNHRIFWSHIVNAVSQKSVHFSYFPAIIISFEFSIQKYTDCDIQNCNFVCCFVWV